MAIKEYPLAGVKTYDLNLGDYLYDHAGHPGYDWKYDRSCEYPGG